MTGLLSKHGHLPTQCSARWQHTCSARPQDLQQDPGTWRNQKMSRMCPATQTCATHSVAMNKIMPMHTLHRYQLETDDTTKHMGVIINKDSGWDKHTDMCRTQVGTNTLAACVVKPAEQSLACLTFVCPILEYASMVWKSINMIETVQFFLLTFTLN